jgi:hypothetical protein
MWLVVDPFHPRAAVRSVRTLPPGKTRPRRCGGRRSGWREAWCRSRRKLTPPCHPPGAPRTRYLQSERPRDGNDEAIDLASVLLADAYADRTADMRPQKAAAEEVLKAAVAAGGQPQDDRPPPPSGRRRTPCAAQRVSVARGRAPNVSVPEMPVRAVAVGARTKGPEIREMSADPGPVRGGEIEPP